MNNKPFSPSCERNQQPIFEALSQLLPDAAEVLEVASGTGQHAVFFATQKPQWQWQLSDRPGFTESCEIWREGSGLSNILPALELDVAGYWPDKKFDVLYSANSLHIMSAKHVEHFFKALPSVLKPGGLAIFYGPFKHGGEYTSDSNREFDQWLKQQHPESAQRDIEWLEQLAKNAGLKWFETIKMPANNELVVFKKV